MLHPSLPTECHRWRGSDTEGCRGIHWVLGGNPGWRRTPELRAEGAGGGRCGQPQNPEKAFPGGCHSTVTAVSSQASNAGHHACPWHPIQLFPEPTSLSRLGQSLALQGGAPTLPTSTLVLQGVAASCPSRNSEKLKEPDCSQPYPRLGTAGESSWREGGPGV